MRKEVLIVFLLLIPGTLAATLYNADSLEAEVKVFGEFTLEPEQTDYQVSEAKARLFLIPLKDYRQQAISVDSVGKVQDTEVSFYYEKPAAGVLQYGFSAVMSTVDKQIGITEKLPYPFPKLTGFDEYLQPSDIIDSTNPAIVYQASRLAEGKDDLFDVAFTLAQWTEENIQYNLSSLTSEASLPASWVLEKRIGVCDEMTSLFIAMARSLGIPARFVKGVSYTESAIFDRNWLPHGWAEVYFPGIGWVSFDPTFGEYGFIDVTHIKLRDTADPGKPDITFEILGYNTNIIPGKIMSEVSVRKKGRDIEPVVDFTTTPLREQVTFGSYNLLSVDVKNNRDHYLATTLSLAAPPELRLVGRDKKAILLKPGEEKKVNWVVQVPETLEEKYKYTFPYKIFTERNLSAEGQFKSDVTGSYFSLDEVKRLAQDEKPATYLKELSINCDYPTEIDRPSPWQATCIIKNEGNKNFDGLTICIEDQCQSTDLSINQETTVSYTQTTNEVGTNKVKVEITHPEIQRLQYLDYAVFDPPSLNLTISVPQEVNYRDHFDLLMTITKNSYTPPENIQAVVQNSNFRQEVSISQLPDSQQIVVPVDSTGFSFSESLTLTITWTDHRGKEYRQLETVTILVRPQSFWDKVIMVLNKIF